MVSGPPLKLKGGIPAPQPVRATLKRKQKKKKRKLCAQLDALPPRAAAAWAERRAQALSPRLLPSSPARPAAEKRGEAPRCLTRPDFPGAAPAGDGTQPAYFTSRWGGDGGHPLTAQTKFGGKERRTPSLLRTPDRLRWRGPLACLRVSRATSLGALHFPAYLAAKATCRAQRLAGMASWKCSLCAIFFFFFNTLSFKLLQWFGILFLNNSGIENILKKAVCPT